MYKNLKVGKKLFIGFASVSLLSLLVVSFCLFCINNIGNLSHSLFTGPYVSTTESLGIKYDLNTIGKDIRSAIIDKNIDKYIDAITATESQLNSRIEKIKAVFGGDPKLVTDVANAEANLSKERTKVISAVRAGRYDEAARLLNNEYLSAYTVTVTAADVLYDNVDASAINFDKTNQGTVKIALIITCVLMAVGLTLAIIMGVVSARSITSPLKKIEKAVDEMSKGSLNINIDYKSKDELGFLAEKMTFSLKAIGGIVDDIGYVLGQMADGNFDVKSKIGNMYVADYAPVLGAMRNINTKLSDTLSQINDASQQVSSGSEQVSSGAQALSQGATEQASSVEELAATITEISQQIKENADNAKIASLKTNAAGDEVTNSNKK
ncbi:MAG: methyl-accepting chemotaxis protein, partial [Oscillospiraceae bacterium]